jgi:lipopolysaccharide biosynthesis glycosyltransferase
LTTIHVACAADDRYAPYSAVMLTSVLDQSDGHEMQIHYLHPAGFSRRASSRLERLVERNGGSVTFVEIPDARLAGLPVRDDIGITATMWLRIYLPEVLPEVERVLYLDIDTLAMDVLTPLWQTPLDDHYVAAVLNVWEPWNVNHPRHLGLPPSQAYFNSGVLLMNLSLMRRDRCSASVYEHVIKHRELMTWPDQDALNVILGSRCISLHPRWNVMNSILSFPQSVDVFGRTAVTDARRNPGIRHFEGPSINKPWHLLCEWEGREAFRAYRRRLPAPWRWQPPTGITPGNAGRWLIRRARRQRGTGA